jgi:hypothetical protein
MMPLILPDGSRAAPAGGPRKPRAKRQKVTSAGFSPDPAEIIGFDVAGSTRAISWRSASLIPGGAMIVTGGNRFRASPIEVEALSILAARRWSAADPLAAIIGFGNCENLGWGWIAQDARTERGPPVVVGAGRGGGRSCERPGSC